MTRQTLNCWEPIRLSVFFGSNSEYADFSKNVALHACYGAEPAGREDRACYMLQTIKVGADNFNILTTDVMIWLLRKVQLIG